MKSNRTIIVVVVLLFAVGIMLGSMIDKKPIEDNVGDFEDEITNPDNDYGGGLVVNETRNLFVRLAQLLERIVNRGITLVVEVIQKLFDGVFGT